VSKYEWERGTIVLPTTAAAEVRAALRTTNNALRERVAELCKQFWADVAKRTRSEKLYRQRLLAWNQSAPAADIGGSWAYSERLARQRYQREALEAAAREAASYVLSAMQKPHQATRADIDREVPAATNRTTAFHYSGFSIVFDGRKVTWHVEDNNHAVERARSHPVAIAFFDALDKVTWTRGSGGEIVGNDEYNSDNHDAGGGANYVTASYGPRSGSRRPR
jgi:hypothetical protein